MRVKFHILPLLILFLTVSGAFAQKETPKVVNGGMLNEKAVSLPEPVYPAAARAVRAFGAVNVQVTIDENGDVISATAVSGHPLLRAAAVQAARQAKFAPTILDEQTVKVFGTIVYLFVLPDQWQFIGKALGDAEVEIEDTDNLLRATDYLASVYPEISKSIKTIADNFAKDEESARFQTNAISDTTAQLQLKIPANSKSLWYFELGLTTGRIRANYFDDNVLRANLPKFTGLVDSFPENIEFSMNEETLKTLQTLSEMAGKTFFSRKDKSKIKKLVDSL